jgi:hypothetical protein
MLKFNVALILNFMYEIDSYHFSLQSQYHCASEHVRVQFPIGEAVQHCTIVQNVHVTDNVEYFMPPEGLQ